MYIQHPTDPNSVINTDEYADIRACSVNKTHVDFYKHALPAGERGEPDLILTFPTEEERDAWFAGLKDKVATKVEPEA